MTTELPSASRAAARSLSAIAFNQVAQVVGSLLFVVLVPRTLGTEVYGQLAFAFALIVLFQMAGELGYQEIFSRYLPEVRLQAGESGIRGMAARLFAVKVVVGIGLGLAAGLAAWQIAGWLSPAQLALIGLSVAARIWAMAAYPLLLGLGETLKWSVETTWRQVVITGLMLVLVRTPSLSLALLAMTLHEVLFLALGLWWARAWVLRSEVLGPGSKVLRSESGNPRRTASGLGRLTSDLGTSNQIPRTSDLLRFGFIFSLANFALVVLFRISPIVVEKLTGSHPQVGFFDLALGGLLLLYTFLGQVAYAFVPILTQARLDGQHAEADLWLGRFVRYGTLLVGLAAGGMWMVSRTGVPLVFGAGFEPAAGAMHAIAAGLLPLPIAWAAVILSAVEKRPARKVRASMAGLGAFLAGAWALQAYGANGIALAFGLALAAYAAGFGQTAWHAIRAGGAGWALALLTSLVFLPFLAVSFSSLFAALAAWLAVGAGYGLLNVALRVVTLDEMRQLRHALGR